MIDKKFKFPDGLFLGDNITNQLETRVGTLLGCKVIVTALRPQVSGNNTVTYRVINNGTGIASIWCDPDSRKAERDGVSVYINESFYEVKIYRAIIEIFGLQDQAK